MNGNEFNQFCKEVDPSSRVEANGDAIKFWNSNDQAFVFRYEEALSVLKHLLNQNDPIAAFIQKHWDYSPSDGVWGYREKVFREMFVQFFKGVEFSSAVANARSQTKGYLSTLSKLVGWTIGNKSCRPPSKLLFDKESLTKFFENPKPLASSVAAHAVGIRTLADAFRNVCELCAEYERSEKPWTSTDPRALTTAAALAQIADWAKKEFGAYRGVKIDTSYSKGVGWFPRVPWVCLLTPNQQAGDGVFVSICFGREGAGAIAGFAESVKNRRGLKIVERTKQKPLAIDVDGPGEETRYNDSYENPQEFKPDDFDEEKFKTHIAASLDRCMIFLGLKPKEQFGPMHKVAFRKGIEKTGFNVIDALPENLVTALAAKPFIILTGNSGTGKTKLAELFAQWLCGGDKARHALIPVGADWTDNRNVFGFVNHIRTVKPAEETADVPVYQSTSILDLLLAAKDNAAKPFFLILDEMNLSHVERYFADFLSAMESREGNLHLHREGRDLPRKPGAPADVPGTLPLPRNVFVIGTVNVDETTYMFSPKVLDRANVIEFRVDKEAPKVFLVSGGKPVAPIVAAPAGYAEAFLELSLRARGLNDSQPLILADAPPAEANAALEKCHLVISDLFAVMQKCHQEFAFRTMSEILRFLAVDYELTADKENWKWADALDAQILQKILPKLHGSKRKLGALLAALATYCEAGKKTEADKSFESQTAVEIYPAEGDKIFQKPAYKDSHRKLCEMILTVRRDQFVSFIQ